MQQLHRQGIQAPLPHPGAAGYMLEHFFAVGPTVPAGMGAAAVGYHEIDAYQRCSGIELSPWEAETLRLLSRAWIDQQALSQSPTCSSPWIEPSELARSDRLDGQMRAIFGLKPRAR
jgi:hypothetical protein